MQCNDASGRKLAGERHAHSEDNHVTNIGETRLIMKNSLMMKMCVNEIWEKHDSALAKFKGRWTMY
jgi:hypothetical protein